MNIQTVYNGMAKRASIHKQAFDWKGAWTQAQKYAPEAIGALAGGTIMSLAGGRKGRLLRFILGGLTGGFTGRSLWNSAKEAYAKAKAYADRKKSEKGNVTRELITRAYTGLDQPNPWTVENPYTDERVSMFPDARQESEKGNDLRAKIMKAQTGLDMPKPGVVVNPYTGKSESMRPQYYGRAPFRY